MVVDGTKNLISSKWRWSWFATPRRACLHSHINGQIGRGEQAAVEVSKNDIAFFKVFMVSEELERSVIGHQGVSVLGAREVYHVF